MIILGSTGSIGKATLELALKFNKSIEGLVAGYNTKVLNEQIKIFKPKFVVVANKTVAAKVNFDNVGYGQEAILEMLRLAKSNLVVNALVGFFGLKPSLETQRLNKTLALANKESLVVAGQFLDHQNIIPIDSEHFSLQYLLQDRPIKQMLITASGGAFRNLDINALNKVSFQSSQQHPTWSMGEKITLNSATLINKLFEVLEAYWLFRHHFGKQVNHKINSVNIDAVIEENSLVHALIEFQDNSITMHASSADMKLAISHALNIQDKPVIKATNLVKMPALSFKAIDEKRYALWALKPLLLEKPHLGLIINAANEIAFEAFKAGQIGFLDIADIIFKAVTKFENCKAHCLDDVFTLHNEVSLFCQE